MSNEAEVLQEQLNTIQGTGEQVSISDGRVVKVYKCKVKQIARITALISTVLSDLGYSNMDDSKAVAELETRTSNPAFLLQLVANNVGDLMSVAASLCDMSDDEFQELDLEDAQAIIEKEVEINKDFFLNRLLPMVGAAREN